MIIAIDDQDLFSVVMHKTSEEAQQEIESALKEADVPLDACAEILRVAVA